MTWKSSRRVVLAAVAVALGLPRGAHANQPGNCDAYFCRPHADKPFLREENGVCQCCKDYARNDKRPGHKCRVARLRPEA